MRSASMEQLRVIQRAGMGGDTDGVFPMDPNCRGGDRASTIFNSGHCFHGGPGRGLCPNPACTVPRDVLFMAFGCIHDSKTNNHPDRNASDSDVVFDQFDVKREVPLAAYAVDDPQPMGWTRPDLDVYTAGNVLRPTHVTGGETYTNMSMQVMKACGGHSVDSTYQFESKSRYDRLHRRRSPLASGTIYIGLIDGKWQLFARWNWWMPVAAGPDEEMEDVVICTVGGDWFRPEDITASDDDHLVLELADKAAKPRAPAMWLLYPTGWWKLGARCMLGVKNLTVYLSGRGTSHSVIVAHDGPDGRHQQHRLLWEGVGFLAARVHWKSANTYYVVQARADGPPVIYLCLRQCVAKFTVFTRPTTLQCESTIWIDANH
jgi:hypothetical protein